VLVVDASVLVVALVDDDRDGDRARARLLGQRLAAPEIVDLEVLSVLRRAVGRGSVSSRRADLGLTDLMDLPLRRLPHRALVRRCWELRDNLAPYDAAYVAAAEALEVPLLTGDRRLAAATGPACSVEVLG